MIKVENSVVINRPIREVFAYAGAGHIRNHMQWSPALREITQTSEGSVGVGTTFHQVRMVNGKPTEIDSQITEFEREKKLSFKSTGSMPATGTYTFESTPDGGTKVTFVMEMEPAGMARMAGPMISRGVKKETSEELDKLKAVLEGTAVTA